MTKNDVLRRIRYAFDLKDSAVVDIFAAADCPVTREQVVLWLKKDDDPDFCKLRDVELSAFLNGLINIKRGRREGPQPAPEKHLTNNMILIKLKIALNLQSEEIIDILLLADFRLSKHELGAFTRKPENKHYRECKDQVLRYLLKGLQRKWRPEDTREYQDDESN